MDEHAALLARFWAKVDTPDDTEACWEWQASRTVEGYGRFHIRLRRGYWRSILAHRLAWELTYGTILPTLKVCHHCDNPPCVRPDHLFLGTDGDNNADAWSKGRFPGRDGEQNGRAKLRETDVCAIRRLRGKATQQQIAMAFGVSQLLISLIHRGKIWEHIICEDETTSSEPSIALASRSSPARIGRYGSRIPTYQQDILARRGAGESYEAIANALGFSTAAIRKWVIRWEKETQA